MLDRQKGEVCRKEKMEFVQSRSKFQSDAYRRIVIILVSNNGLPPAKKVRANGAYRSPKTE